jgi:hypothetical protein
VVSVALVPDTAVVERIVAAAQLLCEHTSSWAPSAPAGRTHVTTGVREVTLDVESGEMGLGALVERHAPPETVNPAEHETPQAPAVHVAVP